MAHTIKGSIFFWYGLLTFGRYSGAWAELGWAWNRKPNVVGTWRDAFPSAEMVECFVIWLYGATNTWMERFGAQPGDPWTVKQVQHVSIAVMYFFAGGAGMLYVLSAEMNRASADGRCCLASRAKQSEDGYPAVSLSRSKRIKPVRHQAIQPRSISSRPCALV